MCDWCCFYIYILFSSSSYIRHIIQCLGMQVVYVCLWVAPYQITLYWQFATESQFYVLFYLDRGLNLQHPMTMPYTGWYSIFLLLCLYKILDHWLILWLVDTPVEGQKSCVTLFIRQHGGFPRGVSQSK